MEASMNREMRIRERAYQIWQDEGRPDGKAGEHWEKARRMIEGEEQTPAKGTKTQGRKPRSRKGTAASFAETVPHGAGANGENPPARGRSQ